MAQPDRLLVPYGTEKIPANLMEAHDAHRIAQSGVSVEVGRPAAPAVSLELISGDSLPMSALRHPFSLPPIAQDLARAASQLANLKEHLVKLCGLWSKPQVAFVEQYLAAVRKSVEGQKEALTSRIGDLAGLVELEHWCFSAPMPLPRAHLCLNDDGRLIDPTGGRSIRVDFLFRDRGGLLAIDVSRGNLLAGRLRELADLERAGVRVKRMAVLPQTSELLQTLGPDFSEFTGGVELPRSPFRGMGLPAPA